MIYFTADPHLGHANIIKFCNRPFSDVHDMNKTLTKNWNNVVTADDVIYVIGDFCWGNANQYVHHLNGEIHLVPGGHDRKFRSDRVIVEPKLHDITYNGQLIVMCHWAMRTWDRSHYGTWHLYGHSHGNLPDDPNSRSFDVGVDVHNYTPISFDQVAAIMAKKTFKPIDHHKPRRQPDIDPKKWSEMSKKAGAMPVEFGKTSESTHAELDSPGAED